MRPFLFIFDIKWTNLNSHRFATWPKPSIKKRQNSSMRFCPTLLLSSRNPIIFHLNFIVSNKTFLVKEEVISF